MSSYAIEAGDEATHKLAIVRRLLTYKATHPLPDDSAMSDHDLTENSLLMCVYNEGLSAAQWESIGAQLGLPTSVLKELEYTWPRSPDRCLLEVVSRWIRFNNTVSKEEFLQALR